MNFRILMTASFIGLAAAPSLAGQQTFAPDGNGLITFVTPSGNIECAYAPAGGTKVFVPADGGPQLSCDRRAPSYLRFVLGKAGAARRLSNVGDAGCCSSEPKLNYGNTWKAGPFTCISERTGLTCTRGDGHGFFISKAKTRVY